MNSFGFFVGLGPPFLRHLAQCDVQHPIMGTALHTRCASEVRANKKDLDLTSPAYAGGCRPKVWLS